jgi:hypothetical protein
LVKQFLLLAESVREKEVKNVTITFPGTKYIQSGYELKN